MENYQLKNFFQKNKFISILILISLASALRNLFLPLAGDEKTYVNIARNMMIFGQYYHGGKPSTVTPSLPFIIALFYTQINPLIGIIISKLVNLGFIIIGFRFLFRFLKNLNLSSLVIPVILLLSIVNNHFVFWSTLLYPESILFCFFWIFIFYFTKPAVSTKEVLIIFASFLLLTMTRYVFAVLGLLLILKLYSYFRKLIATKKYTNLLKLSFYLLLLLIPVVFWFKYVYYIESQNSIGISYFNRFKDREPFYNIKAGLGLIQHVETNKVNGIPAFISLFVPMTGLRDWISSIILLIGFVSGFLIRFNEKNNRYLFFSVLLIMGGLVVAGTGFSRYWLFMLPAYLLGFYYLFQKLFREEKYFILLGKIFALVYVINELRLDYKIFNQFL